MFYFLIISFIAGVLTVLAPCILPMLPVIVGGSISSDKINYRRAFIIIFSLGVSIFVFTLLLKFSTAFISIPALFWQIISGILLIFFGIVTLFPSVWENVPGIRNLNLNSNKLLGEGFQKKNLWGDIIMGAALGPVFSSCSPTYFVILATVLPANFLTGTYYLLAYILGLCLFLLLIVILGQKIIIKLGITSDSKSWLKRTIAIIFIVMGILIITGLDKKIEYSLPPITFSEIGIEQNLLSKQNKPDNKMMATSTINNVDVKVNMQAQPKIKLLTIDEKEALYLKSPELVSPAGYINTNDMPINLAQYIGKKLVLIDFWDYSCINCQRTIPYLNAWYDKYKDKGLVIIGVHTPEFAFEKLKQNVQDAVSKAGIKYPVVLDNDYKIWNAFQNQYWPNEYLIDIDGYIVENHAGEGEYDKTEESIQKALLERSQKMSESVSISTSTVMVSADVPVGVMSPETYFGSNRNEYFGNGERGVKGMQKLSFVNDQYLNILYLAGNWNILPEYAESSAGGKISFKYHSSKVYFVATNNGSPVKLKILLDGKPIGDSAGKDVDSKTSEITIDGDRLYNLVNDSKSGTHTIEIQIEEGKLDAYTFTFG